MNTSAADADTRSKPSCAIHGLNEDVERQVSLFAVSSESTRKANLEAGRRHLKKEQVDRAVAEREEMEHHHH
jgi:hypothetical protein